jgi:hypothetical protein
VKHFLKRACGNSCHFEGPEKNMQKMISIDNVINISVSRSDGEARTEAVTTWL